MSLLMKNKGKKVAEDADNATLAQPIIGKLKNVLNGVKPFARVRDEIHAMEKRLEEGMREAFISAVSSDDKAKANAIDKERKDILNQISSLKASIKSAITDMWNL